MLNRELVMNGMRKLALMYDFAIDDKNKERVAFICDFLSKEEDYTDADFEKAIDGIIRDNETMYNKLPTAATFLKYRVRKELTDEQKNVQRASEVMVWLDGGCNYDTWRDRPCWVWGSGYKYREEDPYDNLKKDPVIMATITEHFGGCGGIIDRFLEQKNTGYTELFRKELVEFMGISEVTVDETLMIGSDDDTVKKIEGCITAISNNFNKDEIIKKNWFIFRNDKLAEGMVEEICATRLLNGKEFEIIESTPIKNAWNKLSEDEKLSWIE